ncbi:MAG: DUF4129 domain-containing protein [Actinobacteria bacterium]|nr:DUF4129 domain-containing protein [Actinomycetota bacterium]
MQARRVGPVLTTLGVLVALALVSIASRGSTPAAEPRARRPGDTLIDVLFTFYLLLLVAGAIFFVYLLAMQRSQRSGQQAPGRRLSLLVLGVFLLAGVAAAPLLRNLKPPEPFVAEQLPEPLPERRVATGPEGTKHEAEFAWVPALLIVGLIVGGIFAAWWSSRRRRRAWARDDESTLGEELANVLEESLNDLRAERDPRRAVIAAYARLERVLAAHGLPRRPSDAPFEYLGRLLHDLSVSGEAVQRLTLLFERAKFSPHEVGEAMKEEAIAALQVMQDELRAAEALAQQERAKALESLRARVAG